MAFPTTSVLDDFNRANTGPPPSSSWVTESGTGHEVVSNQCDPDTANSVSRWNTSYAAAQEAYCTVIDVPASGKYVGVFIRLASAGGYGSSAGSVEINCFPSTIEVWQFSGATWSQLGATIGYTLSANDVMGMDASGATVAIYQNGTSLGTRTTAVTGSGYIGLIAGGTSSTPSVDNFGGGAIVVASGVIPRDLAHTPQHQSLMSM